MDFREEFVKATKVLIVLCLVCYIIQFVFGSSCSWEDIKGWTLNNVLFTYPFYFANGYLTMYLDKWMPWSSGAKRRAIWGTAIMILVNLVVICTVLSLVSVFVYGGGWDYAFSQNGRNTVLIALIIVVVISLIFYSVSFFKQIETEKRENVLLREEKLNAELNALKAQVDPHFLFNSFNVLSGLIDENPPQAQKFLSGLSKIYRYVLENRDEDFVTLDSEINFAQQYLDLQKVRFEHSLLLDLNVSEADMQKKLPALSLQLLLENAIKHNAFDAQSPLKITIDSHADKLVVSNNTRARKNLSDGSGLGLSNIRERYKLHKIEGFSVQDQGQIFRVELPLKA